MKRMTKRVLSVLCVVVMLFSCLSGLTFTVGAASGTSEFADEWTIYYSEEGMTLNYAKGERFNVEFADFNACVPYCQQHNLKGKGTRAIVYPCLLFCDGFVKRYAQRAVGAAICRPRNVVCAAGGCKTGRRKSPSPTVMPWLCGRS